MRTIEAHTHFVLTMAWGRQVSGKADDTKVNGADGQDKGNETKKLVNVIASGGIDQTVKVWLP
jgi:platelet-activating factor acetylhydrolase IB subunit alpha